MSTSETPATPSDGANDFDGWLAETYAETGAFTALVVLVEIEGTTVTPVSSTFLNVVGDEATWPDVVELLASSGVAWNAAAFFPVAAPEGGPLDNAEARTALASLVDRLADDRLALNEGYFADGDGSRILITEVTTH